MLISTTNTDPNTQGLKQSHLDFLSKLSDIRKLEQIRETISSALYFTDFSSDAIESLTSVDVLIAQAKAELKKL